MVGELKSHIHKAWQKKKKNPLISTIDQILVVVVQWLSHVQLFVTPWTIACQVTLSMRFLRQEYWSGLPFPPLGYLPYPGIEPVSLALAGRCFTTEPQGKPYRPKYKI